MKHGMEGGGWKRGKEEEVRNRGEKTEDGGIRRTLAGNPRGGGR